MNKFLEGLKKSLLRKEEGIDGILVTIGLCIIALVLCVVMKDALATFIESITTSMTERAQQILSGTGILVARSFFM